MIEWSLVTRSVILVISIARRSRRTAVLLSVSCGPVFWAGHSWLWWSIKRVSVLIVGSQSASTVDWCVYSFSGGAGVIWRVQLRLTRSVLPTRLVVSCIGSGEASLVAHRLAWGRSGDSDLVVAAIVVSSVVWLRSQQVE